MSQYVTGESSDLFDPVTGAWLGVINRAGRQQLVFQPQGTGYALALPDGTGGAIYKSPLVTPNSTAAATANTAAINAALAGGGYVSIATQGVVWVTGTTSAGAALLIPSNTELNIAKGCEIRLTNSTNCAVIANANAFAAGTAIGSAIEWFGGSPSFGVRITRTGIGAQFPVGSWIGIMGLTSSRNDQAYQGVWQVTLSNGSNIIEFNIDQQPPAGGNSTAGGSYWVADSNIAISGGGTLNGNAANQAFNGTVQFAGDPRSCLTWFRNVAGLTVQDINIRRSLSWGISSNNVVDYLISNVRADTYLGPATYTTDSIHLAGGHRRVLIEKVFSRDSDNIIGLTIDKPSTIVNSYSAFYAPGDTHGIVIRDLYSQDIALASAVGIWGPSDYYHNSVVVDGVHGKVVSAVTLNQYSATAMNGCSGGTLEIRNITALCSGGCVEFAGDGVWDVISVENGRSATPQGQITPLVNVQQNSAAQTIRHLKISKLHAALSNGSARTGPVIAIGNANINNLDISDIRDVQFAANTNLLNITGSGATSIGRISMTNVTGISTASGTTSLVSITGATPVGAVSLNNCHLTGVSGTGHMLNLGASAAVTLAAFGTGNTLTTAAGFITAAGNIARLNGANAQLDGAKLTAPVSGDVFYNTTVTLGGIGVNMRGASTWTRIAA